MALKKGREREHEKDREKEHEPKPRPEPKPEDVPMFTSPRPFEIQGQPVALVTCRECGCAVFTDARELHRDWHA